MGGYQPIPASDATRRKLHEFVFALNEASGQTRYVTRYLEAVLSWVLKDYSMAKEIFRHLDSETDYVDPSRTVKRHWITDSKSKPHRFEGRIAEFGENRGRVWVDELSQRIAFATRDFPDEDVGRRIRFAISFNFIGPIATPIESTR